jgi:cell division protein FtsA
MQPKASALKQIYGLDFGTTKFCIARAHCAPNTTNVQVDVVAVPADGMHRGMLANLTLARKALSVLIEQAEQQFNADITRVVVGVAGSHLKSATSTISTPIPGDIVTSKDLALLLQRAESQYQVEGRELLHTVPIGYRVDDRETISDPLGFRGKTLTGDFFLIDADKFYLKDIVDLCNESGLQVVRLYSEPFASASVAVPDSYKEAGVALADIGGGTTDGIMFKNGRPLAAFTVNVAGKLMTNDLAIGLSLPQVEAEKLKIRFGIKPLKDDVMTVTDLKGQAKSVSGVDAGQILVPRIHELCSLVAESLQPFRGQLGAGILLTGGGAEVKGITDYFASKLRVPVSRAKPVLIDETKITTAEAEQDILKHSTYPTKYSTVIGLLNLELGRIAEMQKGRGNSWTNRYLGQFINWLRELS